MTKPCESAEERKNMDLTYTIKGFCSVRTTSYSLCRVCLVSGGQDESGTSRDLSVGGSWVGKDAQGAGRRTPALPAPLPKLGFALSVKPTQGVKEQVNLSRTVCIKTGHTC